jgi:hypothetical protein
MMQRVQLSIADAVYATALREALSRSCAWRIDAVDHPDFSQPGVVVLDEFSFGRLPLPLSNPERIVLICQPEPQLLAQAWEAGIVSVLSKDDTAATILLAIMAAALRVAKVHSGTDAPSGISPTTASVSAPIAPPNSPPRHKPYKTQ